MIKRVIAVIVLILFVAGGFFAYQRRVMIKDWLRERSKPELPKAESYQPMPTTSTRNQYPIARATLPDRKHLSVPFMVQAPGGDWSMPYQEACEEASMLMVMGYYRGDSGTYASSTADRMILDLVDFEQKQFGYGPDITAREVVNVLESFDSNLKAHIESVTSTDSVMRYVAQGIPVILPADGKILPNPNFRNGGPVYHMLVVTGYTSDQFITNDPGTRLGFDFLYRKQDLMNAIHDWNGGDVPNGEKVMIIVEKK